MKKSVICDLTEFQELSSNEQVETSGGILAIVAAAVGIAVGVLGATYYIGYGVGYFRNH